MKKDGLDILLLIKKLLDIVKERLMDILSDILSDILLDILLDIVLDTQLIYDQ